MIRTGKLRALACVVLVGFTAGPASLVAAQPAPVSPPSRLEAGLARFDAPVPKGDRVFDMAVIGNALPDDLALSFETLGQDPATGAARFANVVLRSSDAADPLSIRIREIRVWNGDSEALQARMEGRRLGETLPLLRRAEFLGVSWSSVSLNEGSDTSGAAAGEMSVARVVLDGVVLHPWTYVLSQTDAASEDEQGVRAVGLVSALLRAVSFDGIGFFDTRVSAAISEAGETAPFVQTYAAQIIEDYHRGDLGAIYSAGANLRLDLPSSILDATAAAGNAARPQTPPMTMDVRQGYSEWTGLSFARLLAYGERGEWPPVTATDLVDFGAGRLEDAALSVNGADVLGLKSAAASAGALAWFFPQKIDISYDGLVVDYGAMVSLANALMPNGDPADTKVLSALPAILERHGLARPASKGGFTLAWDRETGVTSLLARGATANFLDSTTRLAVQLPSFAELAPLFGADGHTPDEAALKALFEKRFAFTGAAMDITDLGGFNALTGAAIDIAELAPPGDAQLEMLVGQTPESLRLAASGFVRLAGPEVAKDFPEATAWINRLADFVATGGTFAVQLAPPNPLGAAYFETADTATPRDLQTSLGLTVTHTPPAPP